MSKPIKIKISKELIDLVGKMAEVYANNTGADPKEYYIEYYLNILPHFEFLYRLGNGLGIKSTHTVLEVGSGLGTRCLLGNAIWNANFTGLEPCVNTYSTLKDAITEFRQSNKELTYTLVSQKGEDTRLPSEFFDFILSFEVLEHVQDPKEVIIEMYRLLKPRGVIFLSTCNYLSFYEGHFRCLWLPFLRKRSGTEWVKLFGRNPRFLDEINFITYSEFIRYLKSAGFKNIRLGYNYPQVRLPEIKLIMPYGFNPIFSNKRVSLLAIIIQHRLVRTILSLFNMQYKIYVQAEK